MLFDRLGCWDSSFLQHSCSSKRIKSSYCVQQRKVRSACLFLCSYLFGLRSSAKILQQIKGADNAITVEIIAQAGAKEPPNDAIPQFVQAYTSHSRVGGLLKETHTGKLVKEWEGLLAAANSKPELVEMGPAVASFMAVKDDEEMVRFPNLPHTQKHGN